MDRSLTPGIGIMNKTNPVSLEIFSFVFHAHNDDDESECPFRVGIEITLFNFALAIGLWQR